MVFRRLSTALLLLLFFTVPASGEWLRASLPGGSVSDLAASALPDAPVFALVDVGPGESRIYREAGDGWEPSPAPPELAQPTFATVRLETARANRDRIAVVSARFLSVSTDGGGSWTTRTPSGGAEAGVVSAAWSKYGGVLLASIGFEGNVVRSTDAGASWRGPVAAGGGAAPELVADPFDSDRFWGFDAAGLFRSDDGGRSFVRRAPQEGISSLAVSPRIPSLLAVVSNGSVLVGRDGGATLEASTGASDVREVTFDESSDALFAMAGERLYRSDDGGRTFHDLLPPSRLPLLSILATPGALRLGLDDGGVLVSVDLGGSWSFENEGLDERQADALRTAPRPDGSLFALSHGDAFRWERSTGVWIRIDELPPIVDLLARGDGSVWVISEDELFFSADRGATFVREAAFPDESLRCLREDSEAGRLFVAGKRLHRAASATHDFEDLPWPSSMPLTDLLAGGEPGRVLAAFRTDKYQTTGGLYRSSDSGATWSFVARPWGETTSLVFEPPAPDRIVGIQANWFYGSGSIVSSSDGGFTFGALHALLPACGECLPLPSAIAANPVRAGRLALGTSGLRTGPSRPSFGVLESLDDGESWTDLSAPPMQGSGVRSLVYDPFESASIWAATDGGVFRFRRTEPARPGERGGVGRPVLPE